MQTENWESTYDENAKFFGIEYGWKFSRQLGINLGASYSRSKGKAKTITGRVSNDDVITQLVPIDISFVYRLAFTNNQIAVPYAAAGYTHTFYKTQLNDDERTGGQSGYHIKGGIQFLLDLLESRAANDMSRNWQVENTYLFVEYYMSKVDDFKSDSIDLGSKGILGGLVFEF
jgi:opacity protein-like surface antigen